MAYPKVLLPSGSLVATMEETDRQRGHEEYPTVARARASSRAQHSCFASTDGCSSGSPTAIDLLPGVDADVASRKPTCQ